MNTWKEKSADKITEEAVKQLKRKGAKVTLFRIPGEGRLGDWRTITSPFNKNVADFLRNKYPNVIIANEDWEAAAKDWTFVRDNRK